ncbi:MAG: hypothetical protein CMJ34_00655 [Phycisphaerae bacterium]|nr:hypothetical protein [Phycisphaerae bacterium]
MFEPHHLPLDRRSLRRRILIHRIGRSAVPRIQGCGNRPARWFSVRRGGHRSGNRNPERPRSFPGGLRLEARPRTMRRCLVS